MKIFSMKVNFNINHKQMHDFDAQDVTIGELREFLIRFKQSSFVPQKFKPTVSIKEFMQIYLNRLIISTEAVFNFL